MSLTDKVIKNTYYHFLSQIINFLAPLFLTPFIIAHIGNTEFGIYAFIIGVAGIFGLFDLSISTSFFKFITEYYNQKKYNELNSVINTASLFYLAFSLVCITIAILLQGYFLSAINIPPELESKAIFTYYIGLAAFSIVNTFGIYNSVIISLQKMYITSLYGIILSVLNFITVAALLLLGYGLYGILCAHIFFISCSLAISMYYSFRLIPELRLGIKYFKFKTLKDMFNIGAQMQVSKLASFASDKYDEFLLAYFSVISNVTYYNIASRVARVGKIIPTQLFTQAAPVAAELNAKQKTGRLEELFEDTTKYLTFVSLPIFAFMFIFAEELIFVWIGPGYEISAHLLRIIGAGSVINLLLSAPGNSITPNIGKPKFSMYEGLIYLSINLILSYFLVKYYGIIGAAYGSTVSTVIAAIYVYRVSVKFFNRSYWKII
jgi:O-antigen/teichoic acid export membrane protein